jgi:drug/metabolite transporter (DMT)-like permease
MISGIMILFFGCFFLEQSTVLKKKLGAEIDIHQISLLVMLATTVFALFAVFLEQDWNFTRTLTSFFLLIFQVLAGIIFQELTNKAMHYADRSTFSVMSTMIIPLLLISDIILGYGVSRRQIVGVIILTIMLTITILRGDFSMKGIKYIISSNLVSL